MVCLHPNCPNGNGLATWNDVVNDPRVNISATQRTHVLAELTALPAVGTFGTLSLNNDALLNRLTNLLPCLYTQLSIPASAKAIVHLCEITLANRIDSANVYDAYRIQNPSDLSRTFRIPPQQPGSSAGEITEMLCGEVLINHGLPELTFDHLGWPIYNRIGYISLNKGKMREVKAFGDILIPCAPSNLIISVKTQAAKERLLYSANMIEGIGFGFFNSPNEFWTPSRMNLFKRMGFTAIYLPDPTHLAIVTRLASKGISALAINVNGKELYRPISRFGAEMVYIAGKNSLHL